MNSRGLALVLLAAILFGSLALRLVWISNVESIPVRDNDTEYYHLTAQALADRDGFKTGGEATAWRVPGYSAFLAASYVAFDSEIETGRLANAVASSLLVLPVFAVVSISFP